MKADRRQPWAEKLQMDEITEQKWFYNLQTELKIEINAEEDKKNILQLHNVEDCALAAPTAPHPSNSR